MPQPSHTHTATLAAAASPIPGSAPPILGAWLLVRRRAFFSFPKRRYVVLTDDHVLMVDSTPVLHMVDCDVNTNASSRVIDLSPAHNCGLPVRIYADTPFQYSKWRLALQTSSSASLPTFYRLDSNSLLGVGVHGIVRRAYPEMPYREHSIESSTTSEYSVQPNDHNNLSRSLFKARTPSTSTRISVELDPDAIDLANMYQPDEAAVPSSKTDKRFLRQISRKNPPQLALIIPNSIPDHIVAPPSVAVKTISRSANATVTVASEILVAKACLNHFAIIRVLDLFQTVDQVHVVMEECMGPSLTQHIHSNGPLSENEARDLFSPLIKAVGYLHASGVVHWDVCPNNVLFANNEPPYEPRLIDFGTARPIDPTDGRIPGEYAVFAEKGKVASLACASPELLTSKAHRYAAKADMWQLGCVLYYILVGKLPFNTRDVQHLSVSSTILSFCKKRSAERSKFLFANQFVANLRLSRAAKELIMKLLCPNPRMRPNALQCLQEYSFLSHSTS